MREEHRDVCGIETKCAIRKDGKKVREIKFRAWDSEKKIMFSSDVLNVFIHFDGQLQSANENGIIRGTYNTPKLNLMQYTGIKDGNGVEIYEGDILNVSKEYSGSFFPTQVIFENGAFRTQISHMHNPVPLTEERALTLEVIGNIYQNKELLTA